jgi:metal-responsive CopG/Arc/MetJ family transcriptional regulator
MNIVKRKRGRPVEIGAAEYVGLRIPPNTLKRVDTWAQKNRIEKRSEALRQLIEQALNAASDRGSGPGRTAPRRSTT